MFQDGIHIVFSVYRWYRDLDGVLQEVRLGMVLVRPLQSVLQFPRVQLEDEGRYICVVSNLMGEDRREITLNVITPLTAHIRPQQQIVDAGTPAMFNCSVHGGSGGMHISWLKDARPLLESPHISIMQQGEVLFLRNVQKSDRGMYQCVARSGDESAQGSAELTLGGVLTSSFTLRPSNFIFRGLVHRLLKALSAT